MTEVLIIPVAAFLSAFIMLDVLHIDMKIRKALRYPADKRIKPFDCMVCLSFWSGIILFFTPMTVTYFIFSGCAASFLSYQFKKQ